MTSPPTRSHWLDTTPSFCNPERTLVTSLHVKLNQLSLTTMSKQLDQTIADAATKNLGFAQALETLTDLELDSRNGRAIERRFRMSRLHAQHSIDSFHFKHGGGKNSPCGGSGGDRHPSWSGGLLHDSA